MVFTSWLQRVRCIAALSVFAMVAPFGASVRAESLSYFVNFTGAATKPTTGLFTYDTSASAFSNFFVSWHGHLFDLTAAANAPSVGSGCPGLSATASTGFALMNKSLCAGLYDRWFAGDDFGSSRFAFSSQTLALPELNGARIGVAGPGTGNFENNSGSGDWSLSAPFKVPGGTPILLDNGIVVFPGGAVFIEGKGLVSVNHLVNFSGAGPLPAFGLFDYDGAGATFANFFVLWNGHLFDMTASANAPSVGGGCAATASSPSTGFALMNKSLCAGLYDRWFAAEDFGSSRFSFSSQTLALPEMNGARISASGAGSGHFPSIVASGDWSLTPLASVPEPNRFALTLLGMSVFAARFRLRNRRVRPAPETGPWA